MAKQPLTIYRAKRDFTQTAEPRGRVPARGRRGERSGRRPGGRYVIQKHAASHLHFDFRLEVGGVLKSWAIPKGPSLDPHDKRLAVEVEDHPLDYGDFEGTIPAGAYGGGTVQLWDVGRWSPADGESADEALARGRLKFRLDGRRLSGDWSLVRMRRRGKDQKNSWLLIKEADAAARRGSGAELAKIDESVKTGRSMAEIAADKPAGKGRSAATVARSSHRRGVKPQTGETAAREAPAARRPVTATLTILGVTVSNLDKILWPGDGITKRELAEYLAAVSERMVPFLKDRPVSIIRAPDGIKRQTFFQRHAGLGTPQSIRMIRVPKEKKPFISVGDAAGLIAMAQLGAVEFHPWGCTAADLMHPDQLTFDLDPAPDVPFPGVVEAAKDLRRRLEALGFASYPKTTGGKGLHVVVPLKPKATWPEAKAFAKAVCQAMAADAPEAYVLTMSKKQRGGRIFLDYLRNDLLASAVSAWSPRARDGAPIAVPLAWTRVTRTLDPKAFGIRATELALQRADDWADFDRSRVPLTAAVARKAT